MYWKARVHFNAPRARTTFIAYFYARCALFSSFSTYVDSIAATITRCARWRSSGRRLHFTMLLFTFERLDNGANYYGGTGKNIYVPTTLPPSAHAHALPLARTCECEREVGDSASKVITARTTLSPFFRCSLSPSGRQMRIFSGISSGLARARVRRYINFYFICQLHSATSAVARGYGLVIHRKLCGALRHFDASLLYEGAAAPTSLLLRLSLSPLL